MRLPLLWGTCCLVVASCAHFYPLPPEHEATLNQIPPPPYPAVQFAVFSDCHVFAPQLGTQGKAFEAYLASDRKLLRQSPEIFTQVVDDLAKSDLSFVLICGDLTKDGEKQSHLLVVADLKKLRDAGKQVFVIPGNHDVRNPAAMKYEGDGEVRTDNVTAGEFASLYADFGYATALSRDPDSLGYSASPCPGLRLLALDSTRYKENPLRGRPITQGHFSDKTIRWIQDQLEEARKTRQAVMVMLHHGLLEHFKGQKQEAPMFVVENNDALADLFRRYGVQVAFTGHFHAQDITLRRTPHGTIYDIETGSLVTYPCPYRIITLSPKGELQVRSKRVEAIPAHPQDFPQFAKHDTIQGIETFTISMMKRLGCSEEEGKLAAPQIAQALVTHFEGDEAPTVPTINTQGMGLWSQFLLGLKHGAYVGLMTDLPPADNDVTLSLE